MIERAEDLARTPNGGADPLSAVLSIVRARGDRAAVLAPRRPQSLLFPVGAPCLHHVQTGEIAIRVGSGDPVTLRANELALLLHGDAHRVDLNGGGVVQDIDDFLDAGRNVTDADPPEASTRAFWGSFSFDSELATRVLQTTSARHRPQRSEGKPDRLARSGVRPDPAGKRSGATGCGGDGLTAPGPPSHPDPAKVGAVRRKPSRLARGREGRPDRARRCGHSR
jgi:hypothetical protein